MRISGGPEVEMTSETSVLGGAHLDEASPLVFIRHFGDLDSSLNVASISLLNALELRLMLTLSTSGTVF